MNTYRQAEPTHPAATSRPPSWRRYLKWEALAALGLGTLGLLVSFHTFSRVWQALAALFSGKFGAVLDISTPLDWLAAPGPVFPLLMLALWLQGAITLFFFNQSQPEPAPSVAYQPLKPSLRYVALIGLGLGLGLALYIGWAERSAQLLPDNSGRLPASNYDEMAYFSSAAMLTQGNLPYRDFLLVQPPGTELFYAGVLKLFAPAGGAGGLPDFLTARWSVIILGLLTIVGAGWLAGRIWAQDGRWAVGPGLAAALILASDSRTASITTLETPVNFFAVLALGSAFEAERLVQRRLQAGLWLLAGALAGYSTLCKLPGVALIFALLVYLLIRRQWRGFWWTLGGIAGSVIVVLGPIVLQAGPGQVLRQMLIFQLLRPQEVREGLDQVGRMADYPDSALTVWLGGLAFAWLAIWLRRGGKDSGRTLIPALWSFPILVVFFISKSFHPWYYVQWALPLALLAGGLFSVELWRGSKIENRKSKIENQRAENRRWRAGVREKVLIAAIAILGLAVGGPLWVAQWQTAGQVQYDRVYRGTGEALQNEAEPGAVLAFDPGYTWISRRQTVRLPATGQFLVDSSATMVYLNLDIDRRSLSDLFGAALFGKRERGQVEAIFQRDRAQALLVEGLTGASFVVLDGKMALPQLTPQSVEFIETAAVKGQTIDYADLYRVRPLEMRKAWSFDNGLLLTPFGLSTSLSGKANADPVAPGEIIRLEAATLAGRSLDLRLVWGVKRPSAQSVKLFVHVIDEKGNRVAQRDTLPLDDKADTRFWKIGDGWQDVHSLPLPVGLPSGRYRVEIGIYDAATGQRIKAEGRETLTLGYLVVV